MNSEVAYFGERARKIHAHARDSEGTRREGSVLRVSRVYFARSLIFRRNYILIESDRKSLLPCTWFFLILPFHNLVVRNLPPVLVFPKLRLYRTSSIPRVHLRKFLQKQQIDLHKKTFASGFLDSYPNELHNEIKGYISTTVTVHDSKVVHFRKFYHQQREKFKARASNSRQI